MGLGHTPEWTGIWLICCWYWFEANSGLCSWDIQFGLQKSLACHDTKGLKTGVTRMLHVAWTLLGRSSFHRLFGAFLAPWDLLESFSVNGFTLWRRRLWGHGPICVRTGSTPHSNAPLVWTVLGQMSCPYRICAGYALLRWFYAN